MKVPKDREARANFLIAHHGHRTRRFLEADRRNAFLDELETLDSEGLGALTNNILAAIYRTGSLEGFGLEKAIALLCAKIPKPRSLRCEVQTGLATAPGDIWLIKPSAQYEFQCKHSLNWSVELWLADAEDQIYRATRNVTPGYLYDIRPEQAGDRATWLRFADYVVSISPQLVTGMKIEYVEDKQLIATMNILESCVSGLRRLSGWSPGGVEVGEIDALRKKIWASCQSGKTTISALPDANQINILLLDFERFMVDGEMLIQALYGTERILLSRYEMETELVAERFRDSDGLFATKNLQLWSGVGLLNSDSALEKSCQIFLNPVHQIDCRRAFETLPGFIIIEPEEGIASHAL